MRAERTQILRVAFMGSPAFSVPAFQALRASGAQISCVYTQPPKPAGRGQGLRKTPVHLAAEAAGIEVRTPVNFRQPADRQAFADLQLDLALVVAYGLILPQAILDAPRLGCINLHASLLPRWRGAAPIHRAIQAGDEQTGVQVMQMEAGLDTGPVLSTAFTPIGPLDTTGSLHDRLALLGAGLVGPTLAKLADGAIHPQPQALEGVTYAHKISALEARIDWSLPAQDLDRHVRAMNPVPGAWTMLETPQGPVRLKILQALPEQPFADPVSIRPGTLVDDGLLVQCGQGQLRLVQLQREGARSLDAVSFLKGTPIPAGSRLT